MDKVQGSHRIAGVYTIPPSSKSTKASASGNAGGGGGGGAGTVGSAPSSAAPSMLGSGAFGAVFKGLDTRTEGAVAVKIESHSAKHPQLVYEYRVLHELGTLVEQLKRAGMVEDTCGIPVVHHFGPYGDASQALVMQRLGPAVSSTAQAEPSKTLPGPIIAHIARCALRALRIVHGAGFVHRDLKPENLLWEAHAPADPVYLIDFGLAKRVLHEDGSHIPQRTDKALVGTPQYAALHAHQGCELSRRDDIESLVYVLVFLAKGDLPWFSVKEAAPNQQYTAMAEVKESIRSAELVADLPPDLGNALRQTLYGAYDLEFEQCPDHTALLAMWTDL